MTDLAARRSILPAPAPPRVLPPEARWFFVLAPPLLAFLFDPACHKDPGPMLRAVLAVELFTVGVGLAVHHGFEHAHARLAPGRLRALLPLAVVPLAVGSVGALSMPLVLALYPEARGDELTILGRAGLVAFAYLGIAGFVGHLQRSAVRQRTRALEARLAALTTQMQPHFLFNSLNVCAGLVHADPDAAEATMDRLAGFLRYALTSAERRLVALDEELDAVESYLEVQRQRFGERLRYEVDADARGWQVPPMILQPLVENAILHGLRGSERGGAVRVQARALHGALLVTIDDDGVGPGGSRHAGTGLGQRNVRERLRLIYGDAARLETGAAPGGGYRCTLLLPGRR